MYKRQIYVSTFSQSMAPSMRIGYMVLPVPVLEMSRAEYGVYSYTVSRFEQLRQTQGVRAATGYFLSLIHI